VNVASLQKTILTLLFAGLLAASLQAVATPARAQALRHASSAESGDTTTPEGQSAAANEEERDESDAYRHSAMVQKIGAMMGMSKETAATVFEVTNFLVLAIFVGYGLVKILPKTFRDRSSSIQKRLAEARIATAEANVRLGGVEDRLAKLDGQIAAMSAQAEQDSARDEARIKAGLEEEKKKIVAAAEQEIASATSHAQKQLQQYAAELAIEQAARKLVVSAETDRLLVQGFAQRLAGDESKKGQN
jgi:F-type H+-transporting ATPase subunit b